MKQRGTLGQSNWRDYLRRDLIAGGGLRRLIEEDGLRGMTSNPSFFEKAIADKLLNHKEYIEKRGQDMPEIRNWKWV